MEDPDPSEEWAIQECSSEEESGKLSWIVNKGLSVGKKVLVTGFVISSVPLVLPPLVVISVIGIACSVPSGLFLASYACTDKLMSKLLPGSTPPYFLLDYGTQYSDEEVEDHGEYVGLKGLVDVRKEEEEVLEDTWGNERENCENDGRRCLGGDEHEQAGLHFKDVQEFMKDRNEIVEENVYEEYVGEYEDEMEEAAEGIELKIESFKEEEKPVTGESWGQLPVDEVHAAVVVDIAGDEINGRIIEEEGAPAFAVRNVVIELGQNRDTQEDEELVRETRGLLEKIREEGMTDNGDEKKQSLEKLSGGEEEGDRKVEEIGTPSENKKDYGNVRIEKSLIEIEHKIETKIDEPEGNSTGSVDVVAEERKPIEPVEGLLGKRDGDDILEAENLKGVIVGTTNAGSSSSQKTKVEKPYELKEGRANKNITNNDIQLNKEKEIVISTNADAREIADESGFGLYDNKNDASEPYMFANHDTVKESEKSSSYSSLETADYMELPVFAGEYECNGNSRISSQKDLGMALNEELKGNTFSETFQVKYGVVTVVAVNTSNVAVMCDEKKIWQQIDAMRKIVGYKAAKKATCFEELKALYLFTGVDPPASSKDPCDLMETNVKLRFLMSIVGVK